MIKRTTNPNEIDFRAKFDLSNKWVVITGACGLIGRAFCEAIVGGNVIVTDLEEADPKKYAEELSVKHNRDIIGFNVNVSNKESVLELKSQILNRIKKINGLLNAHQNKSHLIFEKFEDLNEYNWDSGK